MVPPMRMAKVMVISLLLAACSGTSTDTTTATTATTVPASTTTTAQSTTTTSGELNPREVFAGVSPSIAFVSTDLGTGSGVRYGSDYLITNAHVVWPFESARVVFPDGT